MVTDLFEKNKGLVHYLTYKYFKYYQDNDPWYYEELVQEGYIGLHKASITYSEDKGVKFATYASRCIINSLFMYARVKKKQDKLGVMLYLDGPTPIEDATESLYSIIPSPPSESDNVFTNEIHNILDTTLNDMEKSIFYPLIGKECTQSELCKKFNYSQAHISRIYAKILKKIREELKNSGY